MVWAGRDLEDHPFPILCHGQGRLPVEQVSPSPVPPWPWTFPGEIVLFVLEK